MKSGGEEEEEQQQQQQQQKRRQRRQETWVSLEQNITHQIGIGEGGNNREEQDCPQQGEGNDVDVVVDLWMYK